MSRPSKVESHLSEAIALYEKYALKWSHNDIKKHYVKLFKISMTTSKKLFSQAQELATPIKDKPSQEPPKLSEIDPVKEIFKNVEALEKVRDDPDNSHMYRLNAGAEIISMEECFDDIFKARKELSLTDRLYNICTLLAERLELPTLGSLITPEVERLKENPQIWETIDTEFIFPKRVKSSIQSFIEIRDSGNPRDLINAVKKINKVLHSSNYEQASCSGNEFYQAMADRVKLVFDVYNLDSDGLFSGYWLPYQKRWMNDKTTRKIVEKSRRTGYTFSTSFEWCVEALEEPNAHSICISRSEKTAREFSKDYCKLFCTVINICGETEVINLNKCILTENVNFPNGHKFHILSSNPDAAAGLGGKVLLDEYALHPQQERLYDIAHPSIANGDRMQIISTHRGDSQFLKFINQAKEENDKATKENRPSKWGYHHCNVVEAVAEGRVKMVNYKRLRKGEKELSGNEWLKDLEDSCRTKEAWQQEFMCIPAGDENTLISWELILAAQAHGPTIGIDEGCPCYFGGDIGKSKNPSHFIRGEKVGQIMKVRDSRRLSGTDLNPLNQKKNLFEMMALCKFGAIDKGLVGIDLAKSGEKEFGEDRFKGIYLTGRNTRHELAQGLSMAFEERYVHIDPEDEDLAYDLHALKKDDNTASYTKYYAAQEGEKGHGDGFWALAIAWDCGREHFVAPSVSRLKEKDESSVKQRPERKQSKYAW